MIFVLNHLLLFSFKKEMLTLPTIAALYKQVAIEVKTSQLPVLTVDPNVHTGAFLTGFIILTTLNNTRQCFYQ